MKYRVRQEDTHFYLNPRKKGEFELMLHGGYKLWSYVQLPKELLCNFKKMLQNQEKGAIHHKKKLFRHSIVVSGSSSTKIELSRNIEIFECLLIDESYSVDLFGEDVDNFVEWLGECGF